MGRMKDLAIDLHNSDRNFVVTRLADGTFGVWDREGDTLVSSVAVDGDTLAFETYVYEETAMMRAAELDGEA